jgi:hypothetical protein
MDNNKQIKSEQDILQICKILFPVIERYNVGNIDVVDTIPSYYLLKLDEELWNKFNPGEKYLQTKVENEEIVINRGRITFRLKGDGDYGYPIKTDMFGDKYMQEKNNQKNNDKN